MINGNAETEKDTTSAQIQFDIVMTPVVNYAMQQNDIPLLRSFTVTNNSADDIDNVDISITSDPGIFDETSAHIDVLPAGSGVDAGDIDIKLNEDYLSALTKRADSTVTFTLSSDGSEIYTESTLITTLAADEWQGCTYYPEMLAAFVTPQSPAVADILKKASDILNDETSDPSMDAYQSEDPARVVSQVSAVYSAVASYGITVADLADSLDTMGIRVKSPDQVIKDKAGTCLDLSVLFASALESCGLHPILILQSDHVFPGVWLEALSYPEMVQDDVTLVTSRLDDGTGEMKIFEAELKDASFDEACASALGSIENDVEYILDIYRARMSGIDPIPVRVVSDDGKSSVIAAEDLPDVDEAEGEESKNEAAEDKALSPAEAKKRMWERKLLDLGLRNSLISLRVSRNVIPVLTGSIDQLEDALADGSDFSIKAKPDGFKITGDELEFEDLLNMDGLEDTIASDFSDHKLYSALTDSELNKTVKDLYRAANTSMEENGANTLYLAVGMLRWYETKKAVKARYAPLILLPVDIVRKSAVLGYRISLRDDDPQMNITLLEKLKQDFGIEIKGLDPLPEDEHGIDTRLVFQTVKDGIAGMDRWDVLECACVGIFSFSQFVMWNDIRNRSDDLAKNKIVKSLMEGKLAWDAEDMEIPDEVDVSSIYMPVSADASQLYAIKSACEGKSFVLHGPPGTGKSQTITAMIANLLAMGKSVLFVAEKRAALEVVEERMAKIGLGPFCLELHSNKTEKKNVLSQLEATMEITKSESPEEYAIKAEQYANLRKDLDAYAKPLHVKLPCGMDMFQLVNAYEEYKDAPDCADFDPKAVGAFTMASLIEQPQILERVAAAGRELGDMSDNPLKAVHLTTYSQSMKNDIAAVLDSLEETLDPLKDAAFALASKIGLSVPETSSDMDRLISIAGELEVWADFPGALAHTDKGSGYFNALNGMIQHYSVADTYKDIILKVWKPEFLDLDAGELTSEYSTASAKLTKKIALSSIQKRLSVYQKDPSSPVDVDDLPKHYSVLKQYQTEIESAKETLQKYENDLGTLYNGTDTDWDHVKDCLKEAQDSIERMNAIGGMDDIRNKYCGDPSISAPLNDFKDKMDKYNAAYDKAHETLGLSFDGMDGDWFEVRKDACSGIKANQDNLKEWIAWNDAASEAEEAHLSPVIDYYLNGGDPDQLEAVYHKAVYKALISYYINASPALNQFSGAVFNEKVEQFKKLDDDLMKLTQQELYCIMASRLPNFAKEAAKSSDLGVLQKAIKSGGRGLSIRKMFDEIPTLISKLCPCMLMSPISAAQYLSPDRAKFDVVIFDEASQLPTCKAVGVLARADNAVICGDPKQMPPTSFFSTGTVDEDNLEEEDLESILDDCLALNMPSTHLLWHYRSRHESLITFSNVKFYDDKLYTFPSVNDRESKVRLVHVDGIFERGKNRHNRAEAQAIVDEIIRRYKDPEHNKESIGVVTFNISQQKLIDDMMNEACKNDPQLEQWAYGGEDPLFIKNLENVQGDERDVILFSIGYGPDETGKIYMNFGPLNRDGGWRRLNVAVTRSKCEMVVYSTLTPDQINLTRTSAEGVAALRSFLEYAEGRGISLPADSASSKTVDKSGVADSICAAINAEGYETVQNVGHSAYKVDIGVVDPDDKDTYLLGIILDGSSYGTAKTTRDREVSQISILEGLGWTLHRVWTMDWWDNSQKEIDKVKDAIDKAAQAKATKAAQKAAMKAEEEKAAQEAQEEAEKAAAEASKAEDVEEVEDNAEPTLKPQPEIQPEAESESTTSPQPTSQPEQVVTSQPKTTPVPKQAQDPNEVVVPEYPGITKVMESCPTNDYLNPDYSIVITQKIEAVIEEEAPIDRDFLSKRVISSFGISRGGAKVQDYTNSLIDSMSLNKYAQGDNIIFWRTGEDPNQYLGIRRSGDDDHKRDVKDVAIEEAANAAILVLQEEVGIPQADLAKEGGKMLGYSRSSQTLVDLFAGAVAYCQNRGLITTSANGSLTLTDEGEAYADKLIHSLKN